MSTQIQDKKSIQDGLANSFAAVRSALSKAEPEQVCQDQGERWSIAQQFKHLILSNAPIASALKKPYERLAGFGTPKEPTLSYENLKAKYEHLLTTGVKAPPKFTPEVISVDTWDNMFEEWEMINRKFQERLAEWPESDLDTFAIPHPVLGLLSTRQMLFFTILHNWHHLERIERELRLLAKPS